MGRSEIERMAGDGCPPPPLQYPRRPDERTAMAEYIEGIKAAAADVLDVIDGHTDGQQATGSGRNAAAPPAPPEGFWNFEGNDGAVYGAVVSDHGIPKHRPLSTGPTRPRNPNNESGIRRITRRFSPQVLIKGMGRELLYIQNLVQRAISGEEAEFYEFYQELAGTVFGAEALAKMAANLVNCKIVIYSHGNRLPGMVTDIQMHENSTCEIKVSTAMGIQNISLLQLLQWNIKPSNAKKKS